jgi:hypothetical protein
MPQTPWLCYAEMSFYPKFAILCVAELRGLGHGPSNRKTSLEIAHSNIFLPTMTHCILITVGEFKLISTGRYKRFRGDMTNALFDSLPCKFARAHTMKNMLSIY